MEGIFGRDITSSNDYPGFCTPRLSALDAPHRLFGVSHVKLQLEGLCLGSKTPMTTPTPHSSWEFSWEALLGSVWNGTVWNSFKGRDLSVLGYPRIPVLVGLGHRWSLGAHRWVLGTGSFAVQLEGKQGHAPPSGYSWELPLFRARGQLGTASSPDPRVGSALDHTVAEHK